MIHANIGVFAAWSLLIMRLLNSLSPAFLVNINQICLSQLQAVIVDQLHLMTIAINYMQRIAFLSIQTQFWCQLLTTCYFWLRARFSAHVGSKKWWSFTRSPVYQMVFINLTKLGILHEYTHRVFTGFILSLWFAGHDQLYLEYCARRFQFWN